MKGIGRLLKKKRVIALLVIVLIIGAFGVARSVKGTQENEMTVHTKALEKGSIESVIISKGKINAKTSRSLVSEIDGEVDEIFLKTGETVAKGELILAFDNKVGLQELKKSEVNLKVQEGMLDKLINYDQKILELNFKNATIEYESVASDYANKKTLFEEGAISQADFQIAEDNYEKAQNKYEIEKMTYEAGDNQSEIFAQKSKVELARIEYDYAKERYDAHFIKSPFDGTITYLNVEEGDVVSQRAPLCEVKDLTKMEVKLNLNEYDAQNVLVGNTVTVTSDAAKNKMYTGVVTFVDSEARVEQTQRGVQVAVEILIELQGDIEGLKPGNSAQVKILADKELDAFMVPYEAIMENEEDEQFVFSVENGILGKHKIITGIESDVNVQVHGDTIIEGMHIVLNPSEEMAEGLEVVEIYKDSGVSDSGSETAGKGE